MADEIEFIRNELKRKGYPLENYIAGSLAGKKWHVQPNAYFLDKDTDKGRELDIKAEYEGFQSNSWTYFIPQLLIQCKKIIGNAWIFFSVPQKEYFSTYILRSDLAKWLRVDTYRIFDIKGTHFDKCETLATNYCEIITDKEKSNKRDDNIWECVTTLIKATSQELEKSDADCKQYIEKDLSSFSEFEEDPAEIVYLFYPAIVFEGNMYEAKFSEKDITLEKREYVRLFVDYHSGHYRGEFCIDVLTKGRFSEYLNDVMKDLFVFDKRRAATSTKYEHDLLEAVKTKLQGISIKFGKRPP